MDEGRVIKEVNKDENTQFTIAAGIFEGVWR
jgi:hypothetical protein